MHTTSFIIISAEFLDVPNVIGTSPPTRKNCSYLKNSTVCRGKLKSPLSVTSNDLKRFDALENSFSTNSEYCTES